MQYAAKLNKKHLLSAEIICQGFKSMRVIPTFLIYSISFGQKLPEWYILEPLTRDIVFSVIIRDSYECQYVIPQGK